MIVLTFAIFDHRHILTNFQTRNVLGWIQISLNILVRITVSGVLIGVIFKKIINIFKTSKNSNQPDQKIA
jgi:hypothetical protein